MTTARVLDTVIELVGAAQVKTDGSDLVVTLGIDEYNKFLIDLDERGFGAYPIRRVRLRQGKVRYYVNVTHGRLSSKLNDIKTQNKDSEVTQTIINTRARFRSTTDSELSGEYDALNWAKSQSTYLSPGYVYFLKDFLVTGWTKIGLSADYKSRINWLKGETPFDWAKLIHVVEADNVGVLEHYYHIRYRQYHQKNEWFFLPDEVLTELTTISHQYQLWTSGD